MYGTNIKTEPSSTESFHAMQQTTGMEFLKDHQFNVLQFWDILIYTCTFLNLYLSVPYELDNWLIKWASFIMRVILIKYAYWNSVVYLSACWNNLFSKNSGNPVVFSDARPVLKYSSLKQLELYGDTVFNIQQLQTSIDAIDHLAGTVLPLLTELDPSTR